MIMTKIDEFFGIIDDNEDDKGVRYIKAQGCRSREKNLKT